jgi:hypothetical protein
VGFAVGLWVGDAIGAAVGLGVGAAVKVTEPQNTLFAMLAL